MASASISAAAAAMGITSLSPASPTSGGASDGGEHAVGPPCVECIIVHTKDTIVRDTNVHIVSEPGLLKNARARRASIANNNTNNGNSNVNSPSASTSPGPSPSSPTTTASTNAGGGIGSGSKWSSLMGGGGGGGNALNNTVGSLSSTTTSSRSPAAIPLFQLMRKALGSLQADAEAKALYYLPEGNLVVRHTIGIDGYYTNNQQPCVESLYTKGIAPKIQAMFRGPDFDPSTANQYGLLSGHLQHTLSAHHSHNTSHNHSHATPARNPSNAAELKKSTSSNMQSSVHSTASTVGLPGGGGLTPAGRSTSATSQALGSTARTSSTGKSYRQSRQAVNHIPTPSNGTKDAVVVIGGHTGRRRRNLLFGTTLAEPRPLLGPMDVPGTNVPPRPTWGILMRAIEDILKGAEEKRFIKDGVQLNGYNVTIQAFKLQGRSIIESLVPVNGISMAPASFASRPSGTTGEESPASGPLNVEGAQTVETRRNSLAAGSPSAAVSRTSTMGGGSADPNQPQQQAIGRGAALSQSPSQNITPTVTNIRTSSTAMRHLDAAAIADLRSQYTRLLGIANGAILEAEENKEAKPHHFEVLDGIQLDLKSMSDAVHITNCLEGMFNVSGGGSSSSGGGGASSSRAFPFHTLVTIKLTSIVKERPNQKKKKQGAAGEVDSDPEGATARVGDGTDANDRTASECAAAAMVKPTALNEVYAQMARETQGTYDLGGRIDGPPAAVSTTERRTASDLARLYRDNVDKKTDIYKKSLEEVELADDPNMNPLPTRYFHLVELGDLDWSPATDGSGSGQHLPSDETTFKAELTHFASMLKQLRELEKLRRQQKTATSNALISTDSGADFGRSDSPLHSSENNDHTQNDNSPAPRMRRASTAYGGLSSSLNGGASVASFGGNSASGTVTGSPSMVIDTPARRFAKLHSLQLVEFNHSLRENNLSRLVFSNIDPQNVSIAFLANASFAKARSLMQYVASIRNEPIQIALEGPNGEGKEDIDDELRERIFSSQAEAVSQWSISAELRAKLKDLTTTLMEKTEQNDHLEQRLATLKRITSVTNGGGGTTTNAPESVAGSVTPSRAGGSVSPSRNTNGREFGENRSERDMRHLRLRCQVLKQTYDESVSNLKRAKIEGHQAINQLREVVAHYQAEVTKGDEETNRLIGEVEQMDDALRYKQEAANTILASEVAGTMAYYRRCRQHEEDILEVQKDRRRTHNELNRLRNEQAHLYTEEKIAQAEESNRGTSPAERKTAASKKGAVNSSNALISQRRMEAIAVSNQIAELEERMQVLQTRLKELEAIKFDENDFVDRDDQAYRELYGANASAGPMGNAVGNASFTSANGANRTSTSAAAGGPSVASANASTTATSTAAAAAAPAAKDAKIHVNKFMTAEMAKKSIAQLSAVTHTPQTYSVNYHTERAAKEIGFETGKIQRNTKFAVEAAENITKLLKADTEEANRDTFDAMSDIKTLLTFVQGFEEIDHSEAGKFFSAVCPRTDCHKDGIFVNSILSEDDLWVFPEQYYLSRKRKEMLGVIPEGADDDDNNHNAAAVNLTRKTSSSGTSIASRTTAFRTTNMKKKQQHASAVAATTMDVSAAAKMLSLKTFGGDREAQKKALQKANHNLIQSSVQTHLNRVVLDRCEAWSRFFERNWCGRVNPAVMLSAVSAMARNSPRNGGAAVTSPIAASQANLKRSLSTHATTAPLPAFSPIPGTSEASANHQVIVGTGSRSAEEKARAMLAAHNTTTGRRRSSAGASMLIGYGASTFMTAEEDEVFRAQKKKEEAERLAAAGAEGATIVSVDSFDTETAFQKFLSAESAANRSYHIEQGKKVQQEVEASAARWRSKASLAASVMKRGGQKNGTTPRSAAAEGDDNDNGLNDDEFGVFRQNVDPLDATREGLSSDNNGRPLSALQVKLRKDWAAAAHTKTITDAAKERLDALHYEMHLKNQQMYQHIYLPRQHHQHSQPLPLGSSSSSSPFSKQRPSSAMAALAPSSHRLHDNLLSMSSSVSSPARNGGNSTSAANASLLDTSNTNTSVAALAAKSPSSVAALSFALDSSMVGRLASKGITAGSAVRGGAVLSSSYSHDNSHQRSPSAADEAALRRPSSAAAGTGTNLGASQRTASSLKSSGVLLKAKKKVSIAEEKALKGKKF